MVQPKNRRIATEAYADAAVDEALENGPAVSWHPGKNLYDYTQDAIGFYVDGGGGDPIPLSGYRASDFIRVAAGQTYTISALRHWALYDISKAFHSGAAETATGIKTLTAVVDGYLRFSYPVSYSDPLAVQVEKGAAATAVEPYERIISGVEIAGMDEKIQSDVATALAVEPLVKWTPSKNLYNYATDTIDYYMNGDNGSLVAFAGYRASDFIEVKAGQPYTINVARHWVLYDASKSYISGAASTSGVKTMTPAVDGYLRFSYQESVASPVTVQVEAGSVPTGVVPFARLISGYTVESSDGVLSAPLSVTRSGSSLSIMADHGGDSLVINAAMNGGNNSLFNFTGTTLGGVVVHALNDEAAPIRTQHGTLGANHGLALLAVFEAADHDKTTADLGSVWTSGGREFVLLAFDTSGRVYFGGSYTIGAGGESQMATITLTENLTHVSGATNTAPVDYTKKLGLGARQLYPAVKEIRQAVYVDGRPLTDGTVAGKNVEVRESYEILEYASLYDTAKANIGVPYSTLDVGGCVRVESIYRFADGGVASVDVNLTEMTPTVLSACGLVQAVQLAGTVTRYMPGVKAINGKNWSEGVPLATYTETQKVTTADLYRPTVPPLLSVDVRSDVAFVLGMKPWAGGVTATSERIAEAPTNLWEMRSTKKSYPTAIMSEPAGWGRYEGHCVRAYLTPAQAAQVVGGTDALGAWAALETVTQLP